MCPPPGDPRHDNHAARILVTGLLDRDVVAGGTDSCRGVRGGGTCSPCTQHRVNFRQSISTDDGHLSEATESARISDFSHTSDASNVT